MSSRRQGDKYREAMPMKHRLDLREPINQLKCRCQRLSKRIKPNMIVLIIGILLMPFSRIDLRAGELMPYELPTSQGGYQSNAQAAHRDAYIRQFRNEIDKLDKNQRRELIDRLKKEQRTSIDKAYYQELIDILERGCR